MACTPASTQSAFFQQYEFDFHPRASLYREFVRFADTRKWKEGSKSKKFEKAWRECFGPDVPVGRNVDKRTSRVGAQQSADEGEFSSLLCGLQNLDLEKRASKTVIRKTDVEPEFNMYYGTDASVKARWQELCQDCGVDPLPITITKCKKVQCLLAIPTARTAANISS